MFNAELRYYIPSEILTKVRISAPDRAAGSPKEGDMIARNLTNHNDQWLVPAAYLRVYAIRHNWIEYSFGGAHCTACNAVRSFDGEIRGSRSETPDICVPMPSSVFAKPPLFLRLIEGELVVSKTT